MMIRKEMEAGAEMKLITVQTESTMTDCVYTSTKCFSFL